MKQTFLGICFENCWYFGLILTQEYFVYTHTYDVRIYIKHDFETTEPLSSVLYNLLHSLLLIWECFKDILNYPQNGNNHFMVNSRVRNDYTSTSILFWIVHIQFSVEGELWKWNGKLHENGAGRPGGSSHAYTTCASTDPSRKRHTLHLWQATLQGSRKRKDFLLAWQQLSQKKKKNCCTLDFVFITASLPCFTWLACALS